MSDTDSFIDEVTEEVRRDRLFGLMRKYGRIGILLVVLTVGGAAYREWSIATDRAAAEALGDNIIAALEQGDSGDRLLALNAIETADDSVVLVEFLRAAEAVEAGENSVAYAALESIADNPEFGQSYRDLAVLKHAMISGADLSAAERAGLLEDIATPGRPFRLLAEEQLAMIDVENGDTDAAISRLQRISNDSEVSAGLRQRVSQVIVALGGEVE